MNQFPKLIQDKIDWYVWKQKIESVNFCVNCIKHKFYNQKASRGQNWIWRHDIYVYEEFVNKGNAIYIEYFSMPRHHISRNRVTVKSDKNGRTRLLYVVHNF